MVPTLAPELVEAFRRDGFVVVPDLLQPDELDRFGTAVDDCVARRSRHDTRKLGDKSRYEQSFTQSQNLWEDCAVVRGLTFHPLITGTADPDLARPGALQGGRWAGDRPAPGPTLLAHRRDGHHYGVDSV
jgi:hypothetical protein